jgi:hypothetical protein
MEVLKAETKDKFHHIPVKSKELFVPGSFRTIDISVSKGIKAVIGKLKSDPKGGTVTQKFLFDVNKWTMEEAKAWVKEHSKKTIAEIAFLYKDLDISGSEEKKIVRSYQAKVLSVDKEKHTIKARVSNEEVDRYKEIILLSAWGKNLKIYKQHPVLLSSHNYRELRSQIGEALNIDVNDKGLDIEFQYYVGEGNLEADWAFVLASKGKAMFSVGFIGIKTLYGDNIPEEIVEKYNGKVRAVYKEVELLEVSQVVVGANRGALQMGIDNPDTEQCNYMFEIVRDFGKDIPTFDAEYKEEPKPTKKPDIITDDSVIVSPIEVKNMKELEEIMYIWKSGRVISEKNKKIIAGAIEQLNKSVLVLTELLKLSEPKDEGGEAGKDFDVDGFIERTSKMVEKIKS